jgi:hypothetical protein
MVKRCGAILTKIAGQLCVLSTAAAAAVAADSLQAASVFVVAASPFIDLHGMEIIEFNKFTPVSYIA